MTQFRNYETAIISLHPKLNAFTGMNGMGKTNILDAIYYLCFGKSYFSAGDRFVVKQDGEFFRISGVFNENEEEIDVTVKCKLRVKKEIEVYGNKIEKLHEHIGHFLCVIIAPNDIQALMEGSEARRNFLNNTLVQTDKKYLDALIKYTHLLQHRNSILKNFADSKTFDDVLLESVTCGMYDPAVYIYEKRKLLVEQMLSIFEKFYHDISGGKEICSVLYKSQLSEANLKDLMENNLAKDKILSRTTQGIHKDDLIFNMNDEPLKNFASQGQLKSFIMALKFTQYKIIEINSGKKPMILLDDIFDKLDNTRVTKLLLLLINENFGQIFITDTNEHRVETVLETTRTPFQILKIENGQISF